MYLGPGPVSKAVGRVVSSQPAGAAGLGFEWLPWLPGWAIWAAAMGRLAGWHDMESLLLASDWTRHSLLKTNNTGHT
jgi:hypothetical protein